MHAVKRDPIEPDKWENLWYAACLMTLAVWIALFGTGR
jgi:hypothetical protein